MYDTEAVSVQKGIQEDSVGLGSERRAAFEAGRIYILPDLDRQMTFSPLKLEKMYGEEPDADFGYVFPFEGWFREESVGVGPSPLNHVTVFVHGDYYKIRSMKVYLRDRRSMPDLSMLGRQSKSIE